MGNKPSLAERAFGSRGAAIFAFIGGLSTGIGLQFCASLAGLPFELSLFAVALVAMLVISCIGTVIAFQAWMNEPSTNSKP